MSDGVLFFVEVALSAAAAASSLAAMHYYDRAGARADRLYKAFTIAAAICICVELFFAFDGMRLWDN